MGIAPAQDSGADAMQFARTFGATGEPGAMRIEFDRRGASLLEVRLLDHWETPRAHRRRSTAIEDQYAIVDAVQRPSWRFLELAEQSAGKAFPKVKIHEAAWERHDEADGVRFTLDCGDGQQLERVYRKEAGRRDLLLEIALRRSGAGGADAGEHALVMRGVSLPNPVSDHLLGNPALAIGTTAGGRGGGVRTVRPSGERNPPSLPDIVRTGDGSVIQFAGVTNRFFGAFLTPLDQPSTDALRITKVEFWPVTEPIRDHRPHSVPVAEYWLYLRVPPPDGETRLRYRLFLGPKSAPVFDEQPEYAPFDAVMDVDLTPVGCFCDIPGARLMARFLLGLLRVLEGIVGSWGVAIVLMTLLVRGALIPLNFRMQKSMRAYGERMHRLKPLIDEINRKFANDPRQKQAAMVQLQREHKLFPPLGGCLPLFVTLPVFLGLFTALRVASELRHQPFLGFITDLSQPDRMIELGWGFLPYFNILPVVMVVAWFYLQAGTPLPTDPQQRQVMKIMRLMPILFGVFLFNYASGLMVYMITSSLFGIVETRIVKKILGPVQPEAGAVPMPSF